MTIETILFEDIGDLIECSVCDAEFTVDSTDSEAEVAFCPFCGTDLEQDDTETDEDEESIYE